MQTGPTTHFGFKTIATDEKQARVDDVFHQVADRYDIMNDLMSAGLHRLWKNTMVSEIRPPRGGSFDHLDVAGGTGDVAFRVLDKLPGTGSVTVLDINPDMLRVGAARARERFGEEPRLRFVEGNAEALPLPDNAFDAYTIAFGIRNVPRIENALKEAHRVLRRGGRFLCLEFSRVDIPLLDRIYDAYSFNVIPQMGKAVTGDAQPYRYLVESIRNFPAPDAFAAMIGAAGFDRVSHRSMTGGVVALHSGWKL